MSDKLKETQERISALEASKQELRQTCERAKMEIAEGAADQVDSADVDRASLEEGVVQLKKIDALCSKLNTAVAEKRSEIADFGDQFDATQKEAETLLAKLNGVVNEVTELRVRPFRSLDGLVQADRLIRAHNQSLERELRPAFERVRASVRKLADSPSVDSVRLENLQSQIVALDSCIGSLQSTIVQRVRDLKTVHETWKSVETELKKLDQALAYAANFAAELIQGTTRGGRATPTPGVMLTGPGRTTPTPSVLPAGRNASTPSVLPAGRKSPAPGLIGRASPAPGLLAERVASPSPGLLSDRTPPSQSATGGPTSPGVAAGNPQAASGRSLEEMKSAAGKCKAAAQVLELNRAQIEFAFGRMQKLVEDAAQMNIVAAADLEALKNSPPVATAYKNNFEKTIGDLQKFRSDVEAIVEAWDKLEEAMEREDSTFVKPLSKRFSEYANNPRCDSATGIIAAIAHFREELPSHRDALASIRSDLPKLEQLYGKGKPQAIPSLRQRSEALEKAVSELERLADSCATLASEHEGEQRATVDELNAVAELSARLDVDAQAACDRAAAISGDETAADEAIAKEFESLCAVERTIEEGADEILAACTRADKLLADAPKSIDPDFQALRKARPLQFFI